MPWMFEMFPEINEALYYKNFQQSVASIPGPLGYSTSTLPLRHSAHVFSTYIILSIKGYFGRVFIQLLSYFELNICNKYLSKLSQCSRAWPLTQRFVDRSHALL